MTPETPIRILLVDDHPAVRQGVAVLLAPDGIEVCAEAGNGAAALARLSESHPDLAVVDLSLDGEDGLPLVTEFTARGLNTLVYSMHEDARRVHAAFNAGALGYVTKREFHGVLVQGIREVAAGRRFVSPKAAAVLVDSQAPGTTRRVSPREDHVYRLLGQGLNAAEIAAQLEISGHTAETYFSRLRNKLNLKTMHELRRHAINDFQK
jgi:two-component system, NarL family, invasion response regulator UvrY